MLLTLTARSLASHLNARGSRALSIVELPRFVFQQTALRGLALDTDLFKGWGLDELETLRIQADQAGCPCLLLRESTPVASGQVPSRAGEGRMQRIELVARAAHRLGCNALTLQPDCTAAEPDSRVFDFHVAFFRRVVERVDRLELNVLIEPATGWLGRPDWLVELVKKVGGFRIGTLPTFEAACRAADCAAALRQTAPYAGAIFATFSDHDVPEASLQPFDESREEAPAPKKTTRKKAAGKTAGAAATATGRKKTRRQPKAEPLPPPPSQLPECIAALRTVGYEQILALDYHGSGDSVAAINAARARIQAIWESA